MDVRRKKTSAVIGISLMILLLCVAASLAVLFSRMSSFSADPFKNIIPLTTSANGTNVTVYQQNSSSQGGDRNADANAAAESSTASGQTTSSFAPSFTAYDENTVWQTETEVEIFKMSYDNESGEITVQNNNDGIDKLLAPGTSNEYTFTLENSGNVPLDYTMSMEASFGTEYTIPVYARVRQYDGSYLLGSAQNMRDALDINTVGDSGVLGVGRCAVYTLEWEWPFEQDADEYDTMLGNLAVDDDITFTVKILTKAEADPDPENSDQGLPNVDPSKPSLDIVNPSTGDLTPFGTALFVLAGLVCIVFVSLFAFKQKDRSDEQES